MFTQESNIILTLVHKYKMATFSVSSFSAIGMALFGHRNVEFKLNDKYIIQRDSVQSYFFQVTKIIGLTW